ncbi:MAG: large subunit ribosomal protein L4 [Parcubacteria group bacterium Gr01-1014_66]|nr:MAG: large subunit ribosomal protein L4 [Parcubacteria group bacterium Gr01-1014_66]
MEISIYNQQGEKTGTIDLPDGVFGLKWNGDLVHQVVTSQQANMRRGTAHTKDRSEVRGGGRKPWRQKGTGRARHGSIRSPIWRTGGVTHGPRTEKNYTKKINKKMAHKALFTVLSAKAREQEIMIVENLHFPEAKTKHAALFFKRMQALPLYTKLMRGSGILVAFGGKDSVATRAMRNLPYVAVTQARNLNAHKALQHRYILFPRDSLTNLERKKSMSQRAKNI